MASMTDPGDTNAVICMARAERAVREWQKRGHGNEKRAPPPRETAGLIHRDILPTAITARAERHYMPGLGRHVQADEMCNAFGIAANSTLRTTMRGERAEFKISDQQAVGMLSAAVQVHVLGKVVAWGLRQTGWEQGAEGESNVRLMDVCSGVGTAAEAVEQVTDGRMTYVGAAENDMKKRKVLVASWAPRGITDDVILRNAFDETALRAAPESDVYVMTPDCGKYSKQSQTALREAMTETDKVRTLMVYAVQHRPRVVIMESVAELLKSTRMRACGEAIEGILQAALPDYGWHAQVLDPHVHAGVPMRRERAFWVGTRPAK